MRAAVSRLSAESMEELLVKIRDGEKGHTCGYGENKDSGVCQTQGHCNDNIQGNPAPNRASMPSHTFCCSKIKGMYAHLPLT